MLAGGCGWGAQGAPQGRALHWAAAVPGTAGWGLKLAIVVPMAHGWRVSDEGTHLPDTFLVFLLDLCERDQFVATETAQIVHSLVVGVLFVFIGLHKFFDVGNLS